VVHFFISLKLNKDTFQIESKIKMAGNDNTDPSRRKIVRELEYLNVIRELVLSSERSEVNPPGRLNEPNQVTTGTRAALLDRLN
jgi:hypothetical protein